jgi:hypothetical protein
MKPSWIITIFLLVFVSIFSVQNAEPITVNLLAWEITMSAALVILLAAVSGALAGIATLHQSHRAAHEPVENPPPSTGEDSSPDQTRHVSASELARAMPPMP